MLTELARYGTANGIGFFEFIAPYLAVLWKDWPREMTARLLDSPLRGPEFFEFAISGECPHCHQECLFINQTHPPVVRAGERDQHGVVPYVAWAVMECVGCGKYILGAAKARHGARECSYVTHYPMGTPDQRVEDHVPAPIAEDYREALRCRWVKAFNATAEMCRRAVESSCIDLKVPNTKQYRALEDKIDWLSTQGIITPFMKEVAHKIRLGGNRAAHPDAEDEPEPLVITDEHADAIIKFTREFFHHVYVVRNELDKYDFSKSRKKDMAP